MKTYLQLIRWPNLIVIAYCMYVLRYALLIPLLQTRGIAPVLSDFHFFLIVLSCMLTAAAGYIVNDIYDRAIDKINKPERIIVGEKISVRSAENLYLVLNLAAIIMGIYVSYSINLRSLSLLFPLVAGILYFYSSTYKTILLFGNLLVAALSALIPFTVVLFDLPLIYQKFKPFMGSSHLNFNLVIFAFIAYSVFAFLISFFRELIKDIEDFEGDRAFGKNTFPVTFGTTWSKIIAFVILIMLMFSIGFVTFKYLRDPISIMYIIGLVLAPMGYLAVMLLKARNASDFSYISRITKIIMIMGITYALVLDNLILKF